MRKQSPWKKIGLILLVAAISIGLLLPYFLSLATGF